MSTRAVALMKFLSAAATRLGVAKSVYIVGGAPRNFLLGLQPKDLDLVIDTIALKGKDSDWFAKELQRIIPVRSNLATNAYGVAILTISSAWMLDGFDMKGETIEIANARKESYGKGEGDLAGKGYKPTKVEPATIEEDLQRRELTMNALLWRLSDLAAGPDKAEVLDLLGVGLKHLEDREMHTPVDPDKTFGDDPTRMLRFLKFSAKYGFKIPAYIADSIRRNAPKLKQMPWDAVRKIVVDDILDAPHPRRSIALMKSFGLAEVLKEMLHEEPNFAAGMARSLSGHETHVLLDLLDLGWVMKTPLAFLSRDQQLRLREVMLEFAEGDFDKIFVENLKKPAIDQMALFTKYRIPANERAVVTQIARAKLLAEPQLAERAGALLLGAGQALLCGDVG